MLTRLPNTIQNKIIPEPNSGCWLWGGCYCNNTGYGRVYHPVLKKTSNAHRVIYELLFGEQKGLDIDHLCRNRACVNPEHLEAVTRKVNIQRGITGRLSRERAQGVFQCPKGHMYTEENTMYIEKYHKSRDASYTHRRCILCNREAALRYYYENK